MRQPARREFQHGKINPTALAFLIVFLIGIGMIIYIGLNVGARPERAPAAPVDAALPN